MTASRTRMPARNPANVTPITAGITAGKQTPRRLRRAAEILAAAREVFLDKGFERASIGEIAAKVGVVEGLVYTYFPTKRDLLNEVLRGMYEPLIADLAEGFSRMSGLRSRLRFLVWRQFRVFVEDPGLSRIVLHEVRTSPDYFKSLLHDLQVRYTSFIVRTVEEAVESGELPPDTDAEMIRSMVYGGIEHRMWATLYGHGTIDVESTTDSFTATLLQGMLGREANAAPQSNDPASANTDLERRLARLERLVAAHLPAASLVATAAPSRRRKAAP